MAIADAQSGATIFYGENKAPILLAGTAVKGDVLGFSGGWVRALATTAGVIQARCVAAGDGVLGQTIDAYFGLTIVGGERYSGATANGAIYVAEGTSNGMITQTIPTTSGDATTIIGAALTATKMAILPNSRVDSTAT